ncbi:MAG: peptide-N-glycosidase F-related protein [Bacteroidota bacterium]
MPQKTIFLSKVTLLFVAISLFISCSNDDDEVSSFEEQISVNKSKIDFGDVLNDEISESKSVIITSENYTGELTLKPVTENFEVSIDNENFESLSSIDLVVGEEKEIFIRVNPDGNNEELVDKLQISKSGIVVKKVRLVANAVEYVEEKQMVETFYQAHHAFGDGLNQAQEGSFSFPDLGVENISNINMYIKLDCPSAGCNEWDVFANVLVKDPASNEWLEMGRYITPYGVDNSQREKGFEIDVTDFKNLLKGEVELKSYIETWGSDGWNVSVDFEITTGGEVDYPYYHVAEIIQYNQNSLEGVPYGVDHDFDIDKNIQLNDDEVEAAELRTIITGWGHATPADPDGRTCAEWCFRTHGVSINNSTVFQHNMAPIGCGSNPVQPQYGNWSPDRAGWCPGMEVPIRTNQLDLAQSGTNFDWKYEFEEWNTNSAGESDAYYAISSFVVLKSNEPITAPTIQ